MSSIIKRISNLLTVKSLVTVILTIVFSIIILKGMNVDEAFKNLYTVVISFYFGTQATKEK